MNKDNPPAAPLQPLAKLMKLPRGKKNININPAILPKLDLATLEHTLHFSLHQNPPVDVAVTSGANWIYCDLSVATYYTDWPEDGGYTELFGLAIATAANQVCKRKPPALCEGPYVQAKGCKTRLRYRLQLPLPAEGLLEILRAELQKVLRELPAVYSTLARGPQPGTSSLDEEEDEDEEEADENNENEGEG